MGLLQKALETYDAMEALAGVYEEGKEPLAPIGHIVTKAQIEITIDADGHFIEAKAADKDKKIIIPVTEESASRTSSPAAHPLCDQLGYLLGDDREKFPLYIHALRTWMESNYRHPKAEAVLRYVEGGTMSADLTASGLSAQNEKDLVCWRVVGLGTESGPVWTDVNLMKTYADYYLSQRDGEQRLCMLTGECTGLTTQHLKGAFSLKGNAKIISSNDSSNFTYRGRFLEPEDAVTVGYVASQKAHNALKWVISNQGTIQGGRAFVCWNPQGGIVHPPTLPLMPAFPEEKEPLTYRNYQEDLHKMIQGYQENWPPFSQVVIAVFDAATTGRLAITYYHELLGSDFLERLAYWDETCCWKDAYHGVRTPLLSQIVAYAFGTPRENESKVEADEKIVALQMQRLLACRIDQAAFPMDLMRAIVAKAEQMQNYKNDFQRNTLLFTACAVIRKYAIDHQKEAFDLVLEPQRQDRSYQWGRLLAVMEKIERDTYDKDEKREPNAIRMQSMFVRRPAYAFKIIMEQLKTAYYPRLSVGARIYYDGLIGDIMGQLTQSMDDYARPLTETYLPGYYLQKSALYNRKSGNETEENNDEV